MYESFWYARWKSFKLMVQQLEINMEQTLSGLAKITYS
jgi:hypothetical protein